MRFTSPSRRVLGIFAVSTIGMSTAVLGAAGVAQATTATHVTSATTLTIASGTCGVHIVATGASGGSVGGNAGGLAEFQEFDLTVQAGDTVALAPGAAGTITAGGTGGEGANGGNGGALAAGGGGGTAVVLNGTLIALAAGGGGAGTQAAGGGYASSGDGYNGANGNYNGGDSASDSAVGAGGTTDDTNGVAGNGGTGKVGGAGAAGAGGGGGGLFGGGGGASDGTDGAGGGGGYSLYSDNPRVNPVNADVAAGPGNGSVDYTLQACTADDAPLAPAHLTAQGGDGTLTVDFQPTWSETGGVDPDTWEYQLNSGAWTPFTPTYTGDGASEKVLTGLTNGTAYTVHVRGVSSDGIDGVAASATGTPFKAIGAPAGLKVTTSNSVVTVTWDAPTTTGTYPLAGYTASLGVSYGQSGDLVMQCHTAVSERTCSSAVTPGPGVEYTFIVNAVDSNNNDGEQSRIAVGEVAAPTSVPSSDGTLTRPSGATGGVVNGEKIELHGTGYKPNSLVSVIIYSTPQVLKSVMTDGTGSFTVTVTVPAGLAAGNHTLVAAGVDNAGHMRYMTLPVTVSASGQATLAYTGASIVTPAIAGLVALVAGAGLLVASRRRTTH
ncbi:MAG: fibronectin type III domain-containing protein [Blastococcus sp.]